MLGLLLTTQTECMEDPPEPTPGVPQLTSIARACAAPSDAAAASAASSRARRKRRGLCGTFMRFSYGMGLKRLVALEAALSKVKTGTAASSSQEHAIRQSEKPAPPLS